MDLRIAFVTYEFVPGGSLTFLINISREFQRRQVAHSIIGLHSRHPLERDFKEAGVPALRPASPPRSYEDGIAFGLEQLRTFDATHVVGCLGPQSVEILRYVPEGVSRLGMVQTDEPPVYRILAHYAPVLDAAIGVSQRSCEVLRAFPQLRDKPVYHQPYGIPVRERPGTRAPERGEPIRIIYVGRLVREQKRVHTFPQILRTLVNSGRPFVWTIAGDGAQLAWLKKHLKTCSPHQVVNFVGQVPYDRIPDLMLSSDVFLLPSAYEGLPLTLLEAMAQGVVPVVSDLPSGVREVVNMENGILVDPDNIDGYAAAVLRLDANREELASKGLAASRVPREGFSCEAMADRWLKMVRELPFSEVKWPASYKVAYSAGMRRLGLPFLPAFRPLGRLLNRVARGNLC